MLVKSKDEASLVWRFDNCPPELRRFVPKNHTGYLVLVPRHLVSDDVHHQSVHWIDLLDSLRNPRMEKLEDSLLFIAIEE